MVATYSGEKCCGNAAIACENGSPRWIAARMPASTLPLSLPGFFSASVPSASTRLSPAPRSDISSIENSIVGKPARRFISTRSSLRASSALTENTVRPRCIAAWRAACSFGASSVKALTCCCRSRAWISNCMGRPLAAGRAQRARRAEADVGVLAGAAGLAVAAVGKQIELALGAGDAVDVRPAPGIARHGLLQVRAAPVRHVRRLHEKRFEAFLCARVAAHVEAELVERLVEGLDLRLRHLDLGLADLREVARRHVAGEQADDHDDHEQLEQREAERFASAVENHLVPP